MNNNRLKFRAWDDENLCWVRPNLVENESGVTVDERGFDLVQWTGAYDSDGVEIWNRDIVSIVRQSEAKIDFFREVYFQEGEFMVRENDMCEIPVCGINSKPGREHGSHCCFVVGNVYQNPDLAEWGHA